MDWVPQLSIEMSHRVWGGLLIIYALGAWFQEQKARKLTSAYCWLSCVIGLLIFHTSHYISQYIEASTGWILPIGFFLYALADIAVLFLILQAYRHTINKISLLFVASISVHLVAVFCEVVGISVFFLLYEYIMVFINLVIIGILFRGSYGHRALHQCFLHLKRDRDSCQDVQAEAHHHRGAH